MTHFLKLQAIHFNYFAFVTKNNQTNKKTKQTNKTKQNKTKLTWGKVKGPLLGDHAPPKIRSWLRAWLNSMFFFSANQWYGQQKCTKMSSKVGTVIGFIIVVCRIKNAFFILVNICKITKVHFNTSVRPLVVKGGPYGPNI